MKPDQYQETEWSEKTIRLAASIEEASKEGRPDADILELRFELSFAQACLALYQGLAYPFSRLVDLDLIRAYESMSDAPNAVESAALLAELKRRSMDV